MEGLLRILKNTNPAGPILDKPEHFEIVGDHAAFRPLGCVSLEEAVQAVSNGIAFAREQKIHKILVDIRGLDGFASPGLGSRYFFIQEWARLAAGRLSMAMVSRPELIDPEKIGVTMAQNAGLHSNIFASEEEALAWLKKAPG